MPPVFHSHAGGGPSNGQRTRYYAHPLARKDPKRAGFPNSTFRAEALEKRLMAEFAGTLKAMPDLREELRLPRVA